MLVPRRLHSLKLTWHEAPNGEMSSKTIKLLRCYVVDGNQKSKGQPPAVDVTTKTIWMIEKLNDLSSTTGKRLMSEPSTVCHVRSFQGPGFTSQQACITIWHFSKNLTNRQGPPLQGMTKLPEASWQMWTFDPEPWEEQKSLPRPFVERNVPLKGKRPMYNFTVSLYIEDIWKSWLD